MTEIKPTGTCFEDVTWHFIQTCLRDNRALAADATYRMVHGICHKDGGEPYSHAWIEHGDKVWFSGLLEDYAQVWCKAALADFYAEFKVTDTTKYTFWQAVAADQGNKGTPPPWEPRYRRLCKDYKEEPSK
jgi:hypothetical protein